MIITLSIISFYLLVAASLLDTLPLMGLERPKWLSVFAAPVLVIMWVWDGVHNGVSRLFHRPGRTKAYAQTKLEANRERDESI